MLSVHPYIHLTFLISLLQGGDLAEQEVTEKFLEMIQILLKDPGQKRDFFTVRMLLLCQNKLSWKLTHLNCNYC